MFKLLFCLIQIVTFFSMALSSDPMLRSDNTVSADKSHGSNNYSCNLGLRDNVEAFSVGEGDEQLLADFAQCPRDVLTRNLKAIQGDSLEEDSIRVKIAYLFCRLGYECEQNKSVILSALTPKTVYKDFYADDAIVMIGTLIRLGDKSLLVNVLNAAEWADGALAEVVSDIIVEELVANPENLLKSLSHEQTKTRRKAYDSIKYGLSDDDKKKVFGYLRSVKHNSPNFSIANEMVSAFRPAQDELK